MRILFLLLTFSSISFAQEEISKDLLTDKAPCTFELTIEQLISEDLNFKCPEVFENKPFKIEDFRVKFIGNASIPVIGNSLNLKSTKIAKHLKTGDSVIIFHIKNIIIGGVKTQNFKTLSIKIIE